jgi:hypothetical protein
VLTSAREWCRKQGVPLPGLFTAVAESLLVEQAQLA